MNFLHYWQPQPILFQLSFITVRWYGFLMALSFLMGIWLVIGLARKRNIKPDDIYDLAIWLAIGGIIGARTYEVFFINWHYYQNNLLDVFKIWQGGLAIHGAIIGGGLALLIWVKIRRRHSPMSPSFWQVADLLVVVLALGQAIGRWGNYFNQELFGRPTNLPWGIPINLTNRPAGFIGYQYFHPAFLYESILNFILFLILLRLIYLPLNKGEIKRGWESLTTVIYLVGYSIIRFFMEFIRIDETPTFLGLRLPQWVSLAIILGVIILFFKKYLLKNKGTNSPSLYKEGLTKR